jgi:hypothetical protein
MSTRRAKEALVLVFAGLFGIGCETSNREIVEEERGDLILSSAPRGLYRSNRRVEIVEEDPRHSVRPGCGYLTERAEADINRVLASLDPEGDYRIDVDACRDRWSHGHFTSVHIEGFTHSPFTCTSILEECCTDELAPLEALYVRVTAYLEGFGEENDVSLERLGIEAYPMIEPDEPCQSG